MAYTAPDKATLLFPSVASDNVADRRSVDAKSLPDLGHGHSASHSPDLADDRPSQLGSWGSLASARCAMHKLISFVFGMRFPCKMTRIDAALASLAAIVGGLMSWRRWLAVRQHTHRAGRISPLPSENYRPIASRGFGKWPCKAIVTLVGGMLFKPVEGRPVLLVLHYYERAAMLFPSRVMLAAEPARPVIPMGVALASIYRTCFELISHIRSLHDRLWSEPVRRANAGRVSQMFLTRDGEEKGAFYGV